MTSHGRLNCLKELSMQSCCDVGSGDFLSHLPALRVLRAAYCHTLTEDQVGWAVRALGRSRGLS